MSIAFASIIFNNPASQSKTDSFPLTIADGQKIYSDFLRLEAALPSVAGFLKADGTVDGSTSQAQSFGSAGIVTKQVVAVDSTGDGVTVGNATAGMTALDSGLQLVAPASGGLSMNGVAGLSETITLTLISTLVIANGIIVGKS